MYKKIFFSSLFLVFIGIAVFPQAHLAAAALAPEAELLRIDNLAPIKSSDRILILAPHPDDETIGCAGIIQAATRIGADIHVLYLTNGDNNQFAFIVYDKRIPIMPKELVRLGEVRRSEAITAMKLLGLEEEDLIFLGYPDFGTLEIFKSYWQDEKPYKSMLTRATKVPYKDDMSFGSAYTGNSILRDIENTLLRYRPNKIFVSHPADLNRDHKALYLFLRIALADVVDQLPDPEVYSYLIHWKSWPLPRHYHPELSLMPPEAFQAGGSAIHWLKHGLFIQELENKHKAILSYRSQTQSSAFYLLAFGRKNELFSAYPDINIGALPKPVKEKQLGWKEKIAAFFGLDNPATNQPGGGFKNPCPVVYGIDGNSLLIRIKKKKDISRTLKTIIHLFGYSNKAAFKDMPKITLITKYASFKALDGKKVISPQGLSLELGAEELLIRIPLVVLGDPDFILASVTGNAGISCADSLSFRRVNIIKGEKK